MKKRSTGLARALIVEPEIVLFDEPTTGLDPLMAKTIHDLIVAHAPEVRLYRRDGEP